jgi:hypothetical protein
LPAANVSDGIIWWPRTGLGSIANFGPNVAPRLLDTIILMRESLFGTATPLAPAVKP